MSTGSAKADFGHADDTMPAGASPAGASTARSDFEVEETLPDADLALSPQPDATAFHDPEDTLPPELAGRIQEQLRFAAAAARAASQVMQPAERPARTQSAPADLFGDDGDDE